MTLLFFDTETNGLPADYQASPYEPGAWPDLLQLAWLVQNDDSSVVRNNIYIRQPADFRMNMQANAIHGITPGQLEAGMDKEVALIAFLADVAKADRVIAHNIDFDANIIKANWYQLTMKEVDIPNQFCTMKDDSIKHYFSLTKYPKLVDLYRKLFSLEFTGAHNAMNDVKALYDIYIELGYRGVL